MIDAYLFARDKDKDKHPLSLSLSKVDSKCYQKDKVSVLKTLSKMLLVTDEWHFLMLKKDKVSAHQTLSKMTQMQVVSASWPHLR